MHGTLIVTGASRGIGAATARLAGRRGYRVCVNYRSDERAAAEVVDDITTSGGRAVAVQADISHEHQVAELFATATSTLGPLVGLVNNVGVLERQCRLDEVTEDRLHRVLITNVAGQMLCAKHAVRQLSTIHGGAGGAIVNVSSMASRLGSPGEYIDYAASKGAVDTLTIGLAREVAAEGIRVNAVRPGLIHTGIHARGGEPARVERLKTRIPVQRGGTPEEVAAAILWLLSDEASYVTGTFIDVSGGR